MTQRGTAKNRPHPMLKRSTLAALVCLAVSGPSPLAIGAGADSVSPAAVGLRVYPSRAVLRGPDSVQQLAVEIPDSKGGTRDITRSVAFTSSDPKVVTVDAQGTVAAAGDGKAIVTIRSGRDEAQVPV